ncbi:hypothetical protein 1 [Hubei sobemo-like virus 10]|uniref:hypothetical protein 1 n=1 Tax=Hubei sobemo-like virus 10 TaxID=1923195 RepID=UPI00090B7D5B|nr:hypothetical protein 1 [Hubei sobemo-like virus 10]APG75853.1 hypothetical protein 1 [Hubei sobemo-like virus 10]
MIAKVLAFIAWCTKGTNLLTLIMALYIVNQWLQPVMASMADRIFEVYSGLRLRFNLFWDGYRPGNPGWTFATNTHRLAYQVHHAWANNMSPPEILGYLVCAYYAAHYVVILCMFVRKQLAFLYSRIQSDVLLDFAEKMRPGSMLEPATNSPKFQVEVWVRTDKTGFYKSGQAFCTKFGFFTAYHVVEDAVEVKLVNRVDSQTYELIIPASRFQQVESDVALLTVTSNEIGVLQTPQCKLMDLGLMARSGLFVRVQAYGSQTMGLLEPSEAFGLCSYKGSTIKGFSGSPYYCGNNVFGMHIGGSSENLGFEAAYLYMLGKRNSEDTEDYLLKELERDEDFVWQRSPYDPDEARVKLGGKYYNVDMSTIKKMEKMKTGRRAPVYDPDYEEEGLSEASDAETEDSLPLAPRGGLQYDDSKNLIAPQQSSAPAGVSGTPTTPQDTVPQSALKALNGITLESRKRLAKSILDGRELTPALLRDLSISTSVSSKSKRRSAYRQKKKN